MNTQINEQEQITTFLADIAEDAEHAAAASCAETWNPQIIHSRLQSILAQASWIQNLLDKIEEQEQ